MYGSYFKIKKKHMKNRHEFTYSDIPSSIAPNLHKKTFVSRPPAKDFESESEGENIESESEESYVGHVNEEKM